jgi:hypothetical protein
MGYTHGRAIVSKWCRASMRAMSLMGQNQKTQPEQMSSGMRSRTDVARRCEHFASILAFSLRILAAKMDRYFRCIMQTRFKSHPVVMADGQPPISVIAIVETIRQSERLSLE